MPFPTSYDVLSLVFFVDSSFLDASSFLFLFFSKASFSASEILCLGLTLDASCDLGSSICLFSRTSPFSVSSGGGFVSGTDSSGCLGCCFAAWIARAFALCFFPSACSRRVCSLVALVLQRLKVHRYIQQTIRSQCQFTSFSSLTLFHVSCRQQTMHLLKSSKQTNSAI